MVSPGVSVLPVAGANVYDILRHDRLVIDAAALELVEDEEESGQEGTGEAQA